MKLYDYNKMMYDSIPSLTKEELHSIKKDVLAWIKNNFDNYFMLMCKEDSYYTIFHRNDMLNKKMVEELFNVIEEFSAETKGIEILEDHLEFWLKENDEVKLFIFFPYDKGVIEI